MVNDQNHPKYQSLAEAAKYAGCSQRFLRRRIAAGDLVSSLVGGRRFVTLAAIDQMMEQHSNRQPKRGRGIHSASKIQDKEDASKEGASRSTPALGQQYNSQGG